ncbi:MAG: hypothetical protein GC150_17055 [Rhizobiales bacterium]|nr:hypothetical protein [Hyphomicrobiales bacterium]
MSLRRMPFLATIVAITMQTLSVAAAEQCHTAQGSERRAILAAARQPAEQALKQPVELVVRRIKVCGPWSFVIADMRKPGGAQIDWDSTVCAGDVSHLVGALLRKAGSGSWRVKASELCPTDVPWVDWASKYNAPAALWQ